MIESTALWPSEQLNNKCKLINSEAGVALRDEFKECCRPCKKFCRIRIVDPELLRWGDA